MLPSLCVDAARSVWRDRHALAALRDLGEACGRRVTPTSLFRERFRMAGTECHWRWSERLSEPGWRRRLRVVGRANLDAAVAGGRPVVMVTMHYGVLWSMLRWLRASGIPLAAMSLTQPDPVRDAIDTLADEANGLAGVPRQFGVTRDALREAHEFLGVPGRALAIVFDGGIGARPLTLQRDGVTATVRLGAFRIAQAAGASVLPCLMRARTRMGCAIHFGRPVPDAWIADRQRHADAAAHVFDELWPIARQCPEQFDLRHAPVPSAAAAGVTRIAYAA